MQKEPSVKRRFFLYIVTTGILISEMDFVVTWVDGHDLSWQKEKSKWSQLNNNEANKSGRYRDLGFLRYWFRAMEKYAPWVGTVFFVTAGHIPHWLNTECSKLKVIRHDEFMTAIF